MPRDVNYCGLVSEGRGTRQGYLLLADISGYTAFLTGTELEHAHGIINELTSLIRDQLTPASMAGRRRMRFSLLRAWSVCPSRSSSRHTPRSTSRMNLRMTLTLATSN